MKSVRQILLEAVNSQPKAASKSSYSANEKLPFWFVFDATENSELNDVMGQYSIASLMNMAKGGQNPEDVTVFTNEADAREEAERRLADAQASGKTGIPAGAEVTTIQVDPNFRPRRR